MNSGWLYHFCHRTLWLIAMITVAFVLILNIAYISDVEQSVLETVSIRGYILPSVLMLGLIGIVGFVLGKCKAVLERTDEKKLFFVLAGIYTILAFYLIFNVDNLIRGDSDVVYRTALDGKLGIYQMFETAQYMYRYPHQLGLMLYDQILTEFSNNPSFLFLVNFLFVLGINATLWRLSDALFHQKLTNILTLILSFAFLPQLFFILFAYGLIPGFFFMLLGFYCTVRYVGSGSKKHAAGIVIGTGLAVLLKQNYLIGALAILFFLVLRCLQERKITYLAVISLVVASMVVPGKLVKSYYEHQSGMLLDNPNPSVLWIGMGTDIDNTLRGPGWYDNSCWDVYFEASFNSRKAAELGREKLLRNWEKIKEDPERAAIFFGKKYVSQWCDPMYQSLWTGPLEDCGQYTHTEILQSIYGGGQWGSGLKNYSKALCLAIWLFATAYTVKFRRGSMGWELLFMYFIGGLLFHTFWEAKSQYTYTYMFVLIPFSAHAAGQLLRRMK